MKKTLCMLMAVVMLLSLTACGNNIAKHTVDATLSGNSVPNGTVIQWFKDANTAVTNAANVQLTGNHVISFALTGEEEIGGLVGDFALNEITLTFTGLSSAQTATVSNNAMNIINNLAVANYFLVKGNNFNFSTGYFTNGEVVEVKATFIYTRGGMGEKLKEGFFYFTVGAGNQAPQATQPGSNQPPQATQPGNNQVPQATQPGGNQVPQATQPGGNQAGGWLGGLFGGLFGGGTTTNNNPSGYFFVDDMRFHIGTSTTDHFVYKYEADSQAATPIKLNDATLNMTVYTRESGYDICKVYLTLPDGTLVGHSNHDTWRNDNCHRFKDVDLTAYAGLTITLGIRFAAGNEICPMDYMNGFITVSVPK